MDNLKYISPPKLCRKCRINKIYSDFSNSEYIKKYGWCKICYSIYQTNYRKNNKTKVCNKEKKYRNNNKKKIKIKNKIVARKRRGKDPIFKLKQNISVQIKKCLRGNKSKVFDYLPWTLIELKEHIEKCFNEDGNEWMNWNNQGRYNQSTWNDEDNTTWVWNLDHIIPHSSFEYDSVVCEEFKRCWALTNLRPYSAKQNILDGNRR